MTIVHHPSIAPTSTGIAAVIASLTMQEWAAVVGIIGVFIGVYFGWRRDRREQLKFEYETGQRNERRVRPIREGDSQGD